MATDRKIEPKLAEAAAKTTAVLETLRSRLNRREATPQAPAVTEPPEVPDDLSRQLEQYFAAAREPKAANGSAEVRVADEIRAQVIDGVVDKILSSWGEGDGDIPANIKGEVIARLVEHVHGELLKKGAKPQ